MKGSEVNDSQTSSANIPDAEYEALKSFYNSTNGYNWDLSTYSNFAAWNFTGRHNPCTENWVGINCSVTRDKESFNVKYNVISLSLVQAGLTGSLTPHISGLANLTHLVLSCNSLTGNIPFSFFNALVNMKLLNIEQNYLSGCIPSGIIYLTALESLNLCQNWLYCTLPSELFHPQRLATINIAGNAFSGFISSEICKLTNLIYLDLTNNWFSGPLPACLGSLTNLKHLLLGNNIFNNSIPANLTHMRSLLDMDLSFNVFTKSLPSGIQNLSNLRYLNFEYNFVTGELSTELGKCQTLTTLILAANCLQGFLPTELYMLTNLTYLDLSTNIFSGTIISDIGSMRNLQYLYLGFNCFGGNITTSIGKLTNLLVLNLAFNSFIGEMPLEIMLPNLIDVDFSDNLLVGFIPTTVGEMKNLTYLGFAANFIRGHLPLNLFTLEKLCGLDAHQNVISGPLSSQISKLISLTRLKLHSNLLSGPLPLELFSMKLTMLNLYGNYINGTIPTHIGRMTSIIDMSLGSNNLEGSIPTELGELVKLHSFHLSGNANVGGQIPTTIGRLTQLKQLILGTSKYTGHIPVQLYNITSLGILKLESNLFTGPIATNIGQLTSLQNLTFANNSLTGCVPSEIAMLQNLQQLDLSDNNLYGELPRIRAMLSLRSLNVSWNSFVGSLNSFVDPLTQPLLNIIDISNNFFTGTVSNDFFSLPGLTKLIAASNCFDAELPSNICDASYLNLLVMDALGGAHRCIEKIFPMFNAYITTSPDRHFIPACIFNLSLIQTIHLSGNQLSWELPPSLSISSSLAKLDLSHNKIKGQLPQSLCDHQWHSLNLGFNKINGYLCPNLHVNSSLNLQANRLSGRIYSTYKKISSLSILSGNIFDCGTESDSVPTQDSVSSTYQCGSDTTNTSLYMFLGAEILVVLVLLYIRCVVFPMYISHAVKGVYRKSNAILFNTAESRGEISVTRFENLSLIYQRVLGLTVIAYVFGIIIATSLHSAFSTYSSSYVWSSSFGLLSGVVPTTVIVVFTTFFLFYNSCCHRLGKQSSSSFHVFENYMDSSLSHSEMLKRTQFLSQALVIGTIFILNAAITIAINIYFVLKITDTTGARLFFFQMALAAFKLTWTNLVTDKCFMWAITKSGGRDDYPSISFYRTTLVLITIMIAPCIATAIASPSCFYYIFFDQPNINLVYDFPDCFQFYFNVSDDSQCALVGTSLGYTSYSPTFVYSYQCSSALLIAYSSVFVYTAIFASLVGPGCRLLIRRIQKRLQKRGHQSTSGDVSSWLERIVLHIRGNLLQLLNTVFPAVEITSTAVATSLRNRYNTHVMASNIVIILCVATTFGCAFPLLGIVCVVSLLVHSLMLQIELAYQANQRDPAQRQVFSDAVDEVFGRFHEKIYKSKILLIVVGSTFMSLFVLDTTGDAKGSQPGVTACLTCLFAIPLILVSAELFWDRITARMIHDNSNDSNIQFVPKDAAFVDNPLLHDCLEVPLVDRGGTVLMRRPSPTSHIIQGDSQRPSPAGSNPSPTLVQNL